LVLAELLTEEGLEPRPCSSYDQLRAAASDPEVRLVVADTWGTSHLELGAGEREAIREVSQRAPTILLTGRSWGHPHLADELGVLCLLVKPINIEELLAQVGRCLDLPKKG
jgi:DNA-binding NtrC family response regulator